MSLGAFFKTCCLQLTRRRKMGAAAVLSLAAIASPAFAQDEDAFVTKPSSDYTLIVSVGAYHLTPQGKHSTDCHGKSLYNERNNLGIGISKRIAPDTDVFVLAYQNSYFRGNDGDKGYFDKRIKNNSDICIEKRGHGDTAIVTGVQWNLTENTIGALKIRTGLALGIAYTQDGSYAKTAPELSVGKATLVTGFPIELTTGGRWSVGLFIAPPKPKRGTITTAMSVGYKF